jgi:rubrerythrin
MSYYIKIVDERHSPKSAPAINGSDAIASSATGSSGGEHKGENNSNGGSDSKDEKLPSSSPASGPPGGVSMVVNVSDDPSFPVMRPVMDKQRSLEHTARPTPHGEKAKLMEFAKLMVRMGFDEEISVEALTQTKVQSVELAVERVFRIQGDIDRYERAHQALDREERDQGITRSTPRVPVSVGTLADAQRSINERKEAIAKKALERDHWVCDRCTFINKKPAHICLVCESPWVWTRTATQQHPRPCSFRMCLISQS